MRANFYLQTLQPTTGAPILRRGDDIAGVINRVGDGAAILLGSFLGFSALAYRAADADTDRFLAALLATAGIEPDRCGPLLRRRRVLDEREAWFFINPRPETVTQSIAHPGFSQVDDLLGDCLIAGARAEITIQVPGTNLACLLLSP